MNKSLWLFPPRSRLTWSIVRTESAFVYCCSSCVSLFFAFMFWAGWHSSHQGAQQALHLLPLAWPLGMMAGWLVFWIKQRKMEWRYTIKHEFRNLKHQIVVVQWHWITFFTAGMWVLNLPSENVLSLESDSWRDLPALRIEYLSGGNANSRRTAYVIFEETDRPVVETEIVPFLSQFRMAV